MLALQQTGASKIMTQLKICVSVCMNPVSVTIHCGCVDRYVCEEKVVSIRGGLNTLITDLC